MIRLIVKWLKAGVMVDGQWQDTPQGTPQGAIFSRRWRTSVSKGVEWPVSMWFQEGC